MNPENVLDIVWKNVKSSAWRNTWGGSTEDVWKNIWENVNDVVWMNVLGNVNLNVTSNVIQKIVSRAFTKKQLSDAYSMVSDI